MRCKMKQQNNIKITEKVEQLVDFLCEKQMSQENFLRVAKWQETHKNFDVLDYCIRIYEILNYIGLNDEQVEKFIINNLNIFQTPIEELYKIAFVLKEVNLNDEIFANDYSARRITNYKRLFLRDFIYKRSGRTEKRNAIAPLIVSDSEAYERYGLGRASYYVIGYNASSDEEVEITLNKILKLNEEPITVEDYIERSTKLFYLKFSRDMKKKKGSK